MNKQQIAVHHPGLWQSVKRNTFTRLGCHELHGVLEEGALPAGRIIEVTGEQVTPQELMPLLPCLRQLSAQHQWIVLIAPPSSRLVRWLAEQGVDSSKVLMVHPKTAVDTLWAVEQALRHGSSSLVIAWTGSLDQRDQRRLELAISGRQGSAVLFSGADVVAQHRALH